MWHLGCLSSLLGVVVPGWCSYLILCNLGLACISIAKQLRWCLLSFYSSEGTTLCNLSWRHLLPLHWLAVLHLSLWHPIFYVPIPLAWLAVTLYLSITNPGLWACDSVCLVPTCCAHTYCYLSLNTSLLTPALYSGYFGLPPADLRAFTESRCPLPALILELFTQLRLLTTCLNLLNC